MAVKILAEKERQKKLGLNTNQLKLLLTNIDIVTTRDIFENMGKFGNSEEAHFLKNLGPDRLKRIQERNKNKNFKSID